MDDYYQNQNYGVNLVYIESGEKKSVLVNAGNPTVMIGRNPECTIKTTDGSVSRFHAVAVWYKGRVFVHDPPNGHPTNGTKVDGISLNPGQMLELFPGCTLVCGAFAIRVEAVNKKASDIYADACGIYGPPPSFANRPVPQQVVPQMPPAASQPVPQMPPAASQPATPDNMQMNMLRSMNQQPFAASMMAGYGPPASYYDDLRRGIGGAPCPQQPAQPAPDDEKDK